MGRWSSLRDGPRVPDGTIGAVSVPLAAAPSIREFRSNGFHHGHSWSSSRKLSSMMVTPTRTIRIRSGRRLVM
jgi:hypothetical protein